MGAATLPTRALVQDAALKAFAVAHLPAVEEGLAAAVRGLGLSEPAPRLQHAVLDAVDPNGGEAHRWRPLLVLAAADACGTAPHHALNAAVAIELTHTASLVLDDLPCMDDAPLRRGRPATHCQVGTASAILIAVGLLGRAVELLGRSPGNVAQLSSEWGAAVGLPGMAGGQAMDLRDRAGEVLNGDARRLYRRKTTALAAFAARAGGLVAGAPSVLLDALGRFGHHLGWAYQLRDDVADIEEDGRIVAIEQTAARRARLVGRAERALGAGEWSRPASAEALAAAAWRIAGVAAAGQRGQ